MQPLYSVAHIRAGEQPLLEAQTHPDQLMQQAAGCIAEVALSMLEHSSPPAADTLPRVLILAGAGGNGGDALYAGSLLARQGYPCSAILVDAHHRVHESALSAFTREGGVVNSTWQAELEQGDVADTYELIIDGILGIGGHGGLREPAATLVNYVHGPFLAVDVPSGVSADTGEACAPHITATRTVTFGGLRYAHALSPDCGQVELRDIGLCSEVSHPAEQRTLSQTLPHSTAFFHQALHTQSWESLEPLPTDNKYSGGVVGICAGSVRYPGAGILATSAAVRATPSMVRYVQSEGASSMADAIITTCPEVVLEADAERAGRVQCWVLGPGRGITPTAEEELLYLLERPEPLVLDADALTTLAVSQRTQSSLKKRAAFTLLTPHEGEFRRLGELDANYPDSVRSLAVTYGCAVLLKGRRTLICDGSRLDIIDAESSWAATPGSGDVLSGILGAYLARAQARGTSLIDAAVKAVILHARASYQSALTPAGPAPTSASRIVEAIPLATAQLCQQHSSGNSQCIGR